MQKYGKFILRFAAWSGLLNIKRGGKRPQPHFRDFPWFGAMTDRYPVFAMRF